MLTPVPPQVRLAVGPRRVSVHDEGPEIVVADEELVPDPDAVVLALLSQGPPGPKPGMTK
jgi:hypothetical protein